MEVLVTISTITQKQTIEKICKKYSIVGVYELGRIFASSGLSFFILQLSKRMTESINFAIYKDDCYALHQEYVKSGDYISPSLYLDSWKKYVRILEQWMDGGKLPISCDKYEFCVIQRKQLYRNSYLPELYSKENIALRDTLSKQKTRKLSEVAEILTPRPNFLYKGLAKVCCSKDFNYPFDFSRVNEAIPTNCVLQNNDLLITKTNSRSYLYKYEGSETVYASEYLYVIKCKSIIPEYLYLYLNSDIVRKMLYARRVGLINRITLEDLADFPIVMPDENEDQYKADFNTLTNFGIRDYGTVKELNAFYANTGADEKDVENILNEELANKIKAYREEQLRAFLSEDLKELNACFNAKAYKATLILAGSILEAVLIDWLSEIDHKNYFEEEFYVIDKNGRERRADLIDYINEIKYIQKPHWIEEAAKAHEIRKRRNLVHAKLCLKSDDINENVCREVISYLNDVLRTRGVINQKHFE